MKINQIKKLNKTNLTNLTLKELNDLWNIIAEKLNDTTLANSTLDLLKRKESLILQVVEVKENQVKKETAKKEETKKEVAKKTTTKKEGDKKKTTRKKTKKNKTDKTETDKTDKTNKKTNEVIGLAVNRFVTFEEDGENTKAQIIHFDVKTKELIVRAGKYDIIMFKALKSKLVNIFYQDGELVEGYSYTYVVTKE